MENWGLITGRLSSLLIDPDRPDVRAMKEVASIQSHEVAHMWYVSAICEICHHPSKAVRRFGNITTLEWWTYVYLNEGTSFAIDRSKAI